VTLLGESKECVMDSKAKAISGTTGRRRDKKGEQAGECPRETNDP